eukprot:m.36796 g.36796  ORF g.36796 m.36796 type:complete len:399 (-) comp5442_c0_seq1:45-1241(-)
MTDALLVRLAQDARDLWVPPRVPTSHARTIDAASFLREHVAMNRPLVIDGAGECGPTAAIRWSKERLMAAAPHEVSVEVTPDGRGDAIKATPHGSMFVEPWTARMPLDNFFKRQRHCTGHGHTCCGTDVDEAPTPPRAADAMQHDGAAAACNVCSNHNATHPAAVYYLSHQNSNLTEEMPGLLPDVQDLPVASLRDAFGCPPDAVNIWLGPASAITSLHKDHYENIYLVLRGEKTFTLFPPTDLPFLYETTTRSGKFTPVTAATKRDAHGSTACMEPQLEVVPIPEGDVGWERPWIGVDPTQDVDLDVFPLYKHARPLTVTVRAGQALYLPSLWYHAVAQRGVCDLDGCCLAVNWWFDMQYGPLYTYFTLIESMTRRLQQPQEDENIDSTAIGREKAD